MTAVIEHLKAGKPHDGSRVPLGEVAEFINGAAFKPTDWEDEGRRIIRIQNLNDSSKPFNPTTKDVPEKLKVHPGDLLVSWSASLGVFTWKNDDIAVLNQHIFRVVPDESKVIKSYLRHMLIGALVDMEEHLHGATMKHVNRGEFLSTQIPLPPLDEQRRIAAILDKADELRTKRRQALAQLDGLAESIFESMFGDLRNWNAVSLHELCHGDLRNGVSPSTRGTVTQQVLTLSAVTGTAFEGGAVKSGLFDRPTPVEQRVSSASLLICRGNGNINLVGRGHFPPVDSESVVFPDTIIAAKPSLARVTRGYLGHLWNTPFIRRQISSRARTTNGTYKVNQAALGQVQIPEPPMPLQQDFSEKLASVDRLRKNYCAQAAQIDAMFASLQHRAFRGQL